MITPILAASSCSKPEQENKVVKKEKPHVTKKVKAEIENQIFEEQSHECECTLSAFFLLFMIAIGSFLQFIGLWKAIGNAGKWLLWDSVKAVKKWAKSQEEGD
jgi:hypothetical protein